MKRLITSVLCGLVGFQTLVMAEAGRPKLVVGIMVDQLRTDYIEYLQNLFGQKGFNRLMKDGLYIRDLDYKVSDLDMASSTAVAFTGAYPYLNGIVASQVYDPKKGIMVPVLTDSEVIGNFTSSTLSPSNLTLSTISDEIAIDGGGFGAIYSISPDAQQAIIMTGHAGSSAFWVDQNTGKWATTTYYKEVPQSVSMRNYKEALSSRIDTMIWTPMMEISKYPGVPAQKRAFPFRHTFPRSDRNVYKMFSSSPKANREVTDLAVEYLNTLRLGNRGDIIDMLNVGYTVAPYKYIADGDYRVELEDAYLRLDAQLARLFDAIDAAVGLDNALIFLSSTGYYDDAWPDDAKYRTPGGHLSIKRAESLLNSYFSAKYGNGDYVSAFVGNHIYLDHKLLEEKRLDPTVIIGEAREFISKLSGVANAYTLSDILSVSTPYLQQLRRSIDTRKSGDIYLQVMPGWTIVDDLNYSQPDTHIRNTGVNTPAFILSPAVEATVVSEPVEATLLAPTVSSILRIRSPSGAERAPLLLKK